MGAGLGPALRWSHHRLPVCQRCGRRDASLDLPIPPATPPILPRGPLAQRPLDSVTRRIRRLLPQRHHKGFDDICTGGHKRDEGPAIAAAQWIDNHGRQLGFRAPTALERARSTGRAGYLEGLQLNTRQLYDAVGNHFDADALNIRWWACVRTWLENPVDPGMRPQTPTQLELIFHRVRREVHAMGVPTSVAHPFPKDIRPLLMAAETSARCARAAAASSAPPAGPSAAAASARPSHAAADPANPHCAAEHGRDVV